MTALGIIDVLDPRAARPSGGTAPARTATAGAAAFADVIHDASRAERAQDLPVDAAAEGAPEHEASPENTLSDPPPTAPLHGALVVPETVGLVPSAPPAPADGPEAASAVADGTLAAATETSAIASTSVPLDQSSLEPAAAGTLVAAQVVEAVRESTAPAVASSSRVSAAAVPLGVPAPAVVDSSGDADTTAGVSAAASPRTGVEGGASASVAMPPVPASAPATKLVSGADAKAAPPLSAAEEPMPDAPRVSPSPAPPVSTTPAPASAPSAGEAVVPTLTGSPSIPPPLAPTTPAAAAAVARPVLLPQLAAPVVSLAQAADGDHSLTLTVSPENLGPVTVRAHISGGAIHIELHAPNDLGREALRVILTDLRRDLAAAAPHATLMLSTADDGPAPLHPQSAPNGGALNGGTSNGNAASAGGGHSRGDAPADREAAEARATPEPPTSLADLPGPLPLRSPHGGIDVFA